MAIATDLRKTVEDTSKLIFDSKPMQAVAGVGDMWAEKIRTATESAQGRVSGVQIDTTELPIQLRTRASAVVEGVQASLATLVQSAVVEASSGYDDLAARGSSLLTRIRGPQVTEDVKAAASTTASKVKATATTPRKSTTRPASAATAKARVKATSPATKTAKPKSAAPSAKKATATSKATKAAASKAD